MKAKNIKIALLIVAALMVTMPLPLTFTKLNRVIPLKGDVRLEQLPSLNKQDWFDGIFQTRFEKYIKENIGFRPWFVRVRNQITYSLYEKLNAAYVIRGKDNYFYETNYIKAYLGTDFIGTDSIVQRAERIRVLQDSLQKKDKTLLICIAPGKGSFYPEYIPDSYLPDKKDLSNYKVYRSAFDSLKINYIDFNGWFMNMKKDSKYVLYPKYGIHWSHYGMLLATDSLVSYIEHIRNIDLPDLIMDNYKLSKKLNKSDYDIADGLNLVFKLPIDPLCYPEISWENADNKAQPKVIVIADSFYWSMFGTNVWNKSFSPGGFWYYNEQVYPESFAKELKVENVNHQEAINNNDVIIIMANEANLPKFPWGSVDNFLSSFETGYNNSFAEPKIVEGPSLSEISEQMAIIKADKKWFEAIEQKAKENGISVDSMLYLDAKWVIEYNKTHEN